MPITPFSVVTVSKDTLPPDKRSSESFLDDSRNDEVLRKSSLSIHFYADRAVVATHNIRVYFGSF